MGDGETIMILENGMYLANAPHNMEVMAELLDWASDTVVEDPREIINSDALNDASYMEEDLRADHNAID
jgi:hypothetical protein